MHMSLIVFEQWNISKQSVLLKRIFLLLSQPITCATLLFPLPFYPARLIRRTQTLTDFRLRGKVHTCNTQTIKHVHKDKAHLHMLSNVYVRPAKWRRQLRQKLSSSVCLFLNWCQKQRHAHAESVPGTLNLCARGRVFLLLDCPCLVGMTRKHTRSQWAQMNQTVRSELYNKKLINVYFLHLLSVCETMEKDYVPHR